MTTAGIIFDHPHLRAYDQDPATGKVDTDYAKAVTKRFGRWVLDKAEANYDQAWPDYQYEIVLRPPSHEDEKNRWRSHGGARPCARPDHLQRRHRRADEVIPGTEGPSARCRRSHAASLVEKRDPCR
jgi:hypothetical protein